MSWAGETVRRAPGARQAPQWRGCWGSGQCGSGTLQPQLGPVENSQGGSGASGRALAGNAGTFGPYGLSGVSTPRSLGWPSCQGPPRTCRGQAQVLHNRPPPASPLHVRKYTPPTSTSHAGEHVEAERPLEQLGPVHSRRRLLQRLLAGLFLGRPVPILRTCLGEQTEGTPQKLCFANYDWAAI